MISLALKKWFYSYWDHLLVNFLCSLVWLALVVLGFWAFGIKEPLLRWGLLGTLFVSWTFWTGFSAGLSWYLLREKRSKGALVLARKLWPLALVQFLGNLAGTGIVITCSLMIQQGQLSSVVPLGLASGFFLLWLLVQQWILPLGTQLEDHWTRVVIKAFLVALDNPGLSLVMGGLSLVLFFFSLLGLGLVPGIQGILLWQQLVTKFRLTLYDWQKTGGEAAGVPWEVLLAQEYEDLKYRNLRSLFFPWTRR